MLAVSPDHRSAAIIGSEPALKMLGPLLETCGVRMAFFDTFAAGAGELEGFDVLIIQDGEGVSNMSAAVSAARAVGHLHIIAIVETSAPSLVRELYFSGADVVFNGTTDHYHIFLQCCHFLRYWAGEPKNVRVGNAIFDETLKRLIVGNGLTVALTEIEAKLLSVLAGAKNDYISREKISVELFNFSYQKSDRRIDVHASNLRKKFRANAIDATIDNSRSHGLRLITGIPAIMEPDEALLKAG
jgi:DNA-binding winged helix-turn-helix (wHTH) protein